MPPALVPPVSTSAAYTVSTPRWPQGWRESWQVLVIGLIAGIYCVAYALAAASLLFAGELATGGALAAGSAMLGTALLAAVLGLRSQFPTSVAHVQNLAVAILASPLASMAVAVDTSLARQATALTIVCLASVCTGVVLWLTGRLRLGRMVRFFPQPVLAGFMAGTGWLMVTGGLAAATGLAPGGLMPGATLPEGFWPRALPPLAFACVISFVTLRSRHPLLLVATLLAGVLGCHAVLALSGTSVEAARLAGWLPSLARGGALALPGAPWLGAIDWPQVGAAVPAIGTVVMLCLLATLMNTSALETSVGADVDVDQELRTTGLANLLAVGVGASPGYVGVAMSVLAHRSGVRARGAGLVVALVVLVACVFADGLIPAIPPFVTAGLIIFIGFELLRDWLVGTFSRYSRAEWAVVAVIVALVALAGFALAIVCGLLIAVFLFVYSYARVPVIRSSSSLAQMRSTVEREPAQLRCLEDEGHAAQVLQLQGFVFFGTAAQVQAHVLQRMQATELPLLRFVLLDFHHVSDLDSASAHSLARLQIQCGRADVKLLLAGCNTRVERRLGRSFGAAGGALLASCHDTLDLVLERIEEELLRQALGQRPPRTLVDQLALGGFDPARIDRLLARMTRAEHRRGDLLIQAGGASDRLLFLASGRVTIRSPSQAGPVRRLRVMQAGAILGDIGMAAGLQRTVDVVAEEDMVSLELSCEQIARLEADEPALAILLHRIVARALAEKVVVANRMTDQLKAWGPATPVGPAGR